MNKFVLVVDWLTDSLPINAQVFLGILAIGVLTVLPDLMFSVLVLLAFYSVIYSVYSWGAKRALQVFYNT